MKHTSKILLLAFLFCTAISFAQNENKKWYFGYNAALDFMTNTPTILNNSAMQTPYGSSSIADGNGNLLFYTSGTTVWNSQHTTMANGTGLLGSGYTQPALIIRQPGSSTLYYIFTLNSWYNLNNQGFYYSVVDMSLAGGQGSVTVKNAQIYSGYVLDKLHATKHANGMDFWVMIHEGGNSNNFRAYQFGAGGVNTTGVISSAGTTYTNNWAQWTAYCNCNPNNYNYAWTGQMKFSPNGQKLGAAWTDGYGYNYYNNNNSVDTVAEYYDFNRATGAVTNPVVLTLPNTYTCNNNYNQNGGYGCDFSPDGSKFYVNKDWSYYYCNNQNNGDIMVAQWNMNAGSASAVQSSSVAIYTHTYVNNNNNYIYMGNMQLAPDDKIYIAQVYTGGNPNAWTHSINVINTPNALGSACNFSFLAQPVSTITGNTSNGSSYYSLPNQIPQPCLTFTAAHTASLCAGLNTATAAILAVANNSGAVTYTWTDGGTNTYTTPSINNLASGSTWTAMVKDTTACISTTVITILQPPAITLNISSASPTACVNSNILLNYTVSGGATTPTCNWQGNGAGIGATNWLATQNTAGTYIYTISAIDSLNCTTNNTISVNFISNPVLGALPNQTICTAQSATLSANNVGVYSYTWQPGGANTSSIVVSPTSPITVYTLHVVDTTNFCSSGSTLAVSFYTNPILVTTPNQTICTAQSATLNASGASVYTWQPNSIISSSIVVSPTVPVTIYTVSATNNICGTSNTIQVNFYPNPSLTLTPTQSVCPSFAANIIVNGANTYTWNTGFVGANLSIVPSTQLTTYTVTGTGTGGCVSTATTQAFVYPKPTLSFATYSITCANLGSATVTPSGGYGSYNYTWTPTAQTTSAAAGLTPGNYTVTVHDNGTGCTMDSTVTFYSLIPLTGTLHNQNALKCNSVNTGTAYFTNFSGGSGSQNYVWTDGTVSLTNASPNNLHAATWSVTVSDGLTGCQVFSVFTITQPATLTMNVASSSASICVGSNFTLTATASGGAGAYSYNWSASASGGAAFVVSPPVGTHVYSATVQDNNLCYASNVLTVHVVPQPNLIVSLSSASMCAEGLNNSPNSITVTASGANSYTLNASNYLSNSGQGASFELSTLPPYQNTGISTATLFGGNGVCTLSTTTSFSILPNPTISVTNPTPAICAGLGYTYTAQGANTYTWTSATPHSSIYNLSNMGIANPTISSVYSVIGNSFGCYSNIETTSIGTNSYPNLTVTPTQTYVCIGSAVQLKADGTDGTVYSWSPSESLNQTVGDIVLANPQTQQIYTVIANLNNCTVSATATVEVKQLPKPQISVLKNGKCVNDSLVLKGSGGMSYKWLFPNGQYSEGFDVLRLKASSETYSGTYTLTVYDYYYCAGSKTQSISINPLPEGTIKAKNTEGCVPLCNEFIYKPTITPQAQSSVTAISWQMNNKNFSGNNINYCFNQAGGYVVQAHVRDANNCLNTFALPISVYPQPTADFEFSPKEPTENLDEVNFINTSKGAQKFSWQFADGSLLSSEEQTNYLFENAGIYVVALIAQSEKECLDTIIKTIYVKPDFTVFVPNVFTPNGDNKNEVFKPVTRAQTQIRLQIFNRWGHLMFESTDINKGWDGTFNGEPCKSEVYVWKLVISNSEEEKRLEGTVLLQR